MAPERAPTARGPARGRRLEPGTLRRATSLDVLQPRWTEPFEVRAVGRDLRRGADGTLAVAGAAWFTATIARDGDATVLAVDGPVPERLRPLAGASATTGLRRRLPAGPPGDLLGALLDDLPAVARLSSAARLRAGDAVADIPPPSMPPDGVCVSWGPSTWLRRRTSAGGAPHGTRPAAPDWDGPDGPSADPAPVPPWGLRRERRIDLSADGTVHAAFRDVLTCGDGSREVLHEYGLRARLGLDGTLADVEADPRVLPSPDCPAAAATARRAEGLPLATLRTELRGRIDAAAGCTHLTDALRALGDLPRLRQVDPAGSPPPGPTGGRHA